MAEYVIAGHCPECGYEVDGAAFVGPEEAVSPEPEDLAICIQCGSCGIYVLAEDGTTLTLRKPTAEEDDLIENNETIQSARAMIIGISILLKEFGQ